MPVPQGLVTVRGLRGEQRGKGAPVARTVDLTIEDLARAAGMTVRNARSYQSRGLLPPGLRRGREVRYGHEHVARLRLVRSLQESGLSLKVVHDLLEQGTAEEELARLARERLGTVWSKATRVPLAPALVERYRRLDPDGVQEMVDTGVLVEVDGELSGSAAMMGLVRALFSHGLELDAIGRVILAAARAAETAVPDVEAEAAGAGDEDGGALVQLAACAFADVLARRLDLF